MIIFRTAVIFYDLFAGGCAITHCSMLRKKSENYLINDISDVVELFYDAVMGKYKNETRWISREDFYNFKAKDPYIRYCWSFGNRGLEYMYSREVESWKKSPALCACFRRLLRVCKVRNKYYECR